MGQPLRCSEDLKMAKWYEMVSPPQNPLCAPYCVLHSQAENLGRYHADYN